ncbi:MAG: helix-turn-helix transcriptional regulator [Solobacterium sp.]|nr:helix-turn-helix transcriptional regulator [Solobacterium sp.]
MFTERFLQLFRLLGLTPKQLAAALHYDPSNISRLLSGRRVPAPFGTGAQRLSDGIVRIAFEKKLQKELAVLVGREAHTPADLSKAVLAWLFEDCQASMQRAEKPKYPFRSFGEKLDALMTLGEISNSRLSRLMAIDTSYISRFRNGLRSPRSNPQMMHNLCEVLCQRIVDKNRLASLASLLKVSEDDLKEEEDAVRLLHDWLFDIEKEDSSSDIEQLVESIRSVPAVFPDVPVPPVVVQDTYRGTDGLRNAVVRFLVTALETGARELWLYSDQDMEWLTGDPAFFVLWASLMQKCVLNGIHIRIIHTLERDVRELVNAISGWLPLYLSRCITSYYCPRSRNTHFSVSIFLCPDTAAVSAGNVVGRETQDGIYHYHTDPDSLDAWKQMYLSLQKEAHLLVRMSPPRELSFAPDETSVLRENFSPATLPEATLAKMLAGNPQAGEVIAAYRLQKQAFETALMTGRIDEYAAVDKDAGLTIAGVHLSYTDETFREHVENVIRLCELTAYQAWLLPEMPFPDTAISVARDSVEVTRRLAPAATFRISHPALCAGFTAYIDHLRRTLSIQDLQQLLK